MKKLVLSVLFSASCFAFPMEGMTNFGPFINCELENNFNHKLVVTDYTYRVWLTNGSFQDIFYRCSYGCELRPYERKNFSGPRNAPFVMDATCRANVMRVRR